MYAVSCLEGLHISQSVIHEQTRVLRQGLREHALLLFLAMLVMWPRMLVLMQKTEKEGERLIISTAQSLPSRKC